jgi:hypothetical protein
VYGEADPSPLTTGGAVAPGVGTGFLVADNVTATYTRAGGETVAGSPYHITATLNAAAGVLANYVITNAGADFTINHRPATWTTNGASKTYGDSDPNPLTTGSAVAPGAGTGFLVADGVTATYARAAGESVAGSPYHITATLNAAGGVLANYVITNAGADFTINKAPLLVTANNQAITYGGPSPSFTVTFAGFVNGEDRSVLSGSEVFNFAGKPPTSYGPSTTIPTNAGTYAVRPSGFSSTNYQITYAAGTFTIAKATLTATADDASRMYGAVNPAFTATLTGFVSGEILGTSGVTGSAACSTTATASSPVPGPYAITCTIGTLAASNYTFAFAPGQLTVTKAPLTVTADNKSRTYGTATPILTATITGFANGETLLSSGVTGVAGCTTTATTLSTVAGSPYPITCALGTLAANNYSFGFAPGQLTITQAALTLVVDNKSKLLNAPNPPLTGTLTGVVAGDDITASYSTTAVTNSPVGTHPITGTLNDPHGRLGNYTVSNTPGTLTITYAVAGLCLGETGHQILQPINWQGDSVFKQKSTVPAKFRVCDANGVSIGTPGVVTSFKLIQTMAGTVTTALDVTPDSTTPDTAFRWSSSDQQWIFNINTKSSAPNVTYFFQVTLNDGSTIPFQFGLR